MFETTMTESILGKAQEKNLLDLHIQNFREFTTDKHRHVDDYPYGGGAGMLLQVQPIDDTLQAIKKETPETKKRIILLDPAGKTFDQKMAESFSEEDHLVFICGHYEGYDERIRTQLVTDEVSIGDYVLTGGELPAMTMTDAIVRLIPGVLGNQQSHEDDSFQDGLLEFPQYTRPRSYLGHDVPDVLLSGNHAHIEQWRHEQKLINTWVKRPDLLEQYPLTTEDQKILETYKKQLKK